MVSYAVIAGIDEDSETESVIVSELDIPSVTDSETERVSVSVDVYAGNVFVDDNSETESVKVSVDETYAYPIVCAFATSCTLSVIVSSDATTNCADGTHVDFSETERATVSAEFTRLLPPIICVA